MTQTADNTVAIVVGIEDYEISKGLGRDARWDLDGPAFDAIRFVKWLHRQEVPASNIHVFLSALQNPEHATQLSRLGVTNIYDAKQATLENFFANQLRRLAPDAEGQLLLLWGGHGILRNSEERHLYCADVLLNTVRTIWLNDLLRVLRQIEGFRRQYIFVDACANAHEDTGLNPPRNHPLGPEKPPSGVEQYALLAASAGQLAVNRRDVHAGLFSTYLFEALESSDQWPAFQSLEKVLLDRFEQKYAEDPTFQQRPVSLTFVDHTNRSKSHSYGGVPVPRSFQALAEATGYSVAALQKLAAAAQRCRSLEDAGGRSLFYKKFAFQEPVFSSDDDYDRLNLLARILLANQARSFLRELEAQEPDVSAYAELGVAFQQASLVHQARLALRPLQIQTSEYRRLFSLLQPARESSNLEDMLEALAARGPIGSCALLDFVFRVAELGGCADPGALRAWVKERADPHHHADLEQRRLQARSYSAVVSIKPRPGKDESPDSFTVWLLENERATGKVWTERFDSGSDMDTLSAELLHRLEAALAEAIDAGDGQVFVEISLPMEMMRWRFDQLGIKPAHSKFKRPFGREHPVVIRWRERQKSKRLSDPWCRVSTFIRNRLAESAPRWTRLPDDPDSVFVHSLERPAAAFLFLGAPQPPLQDNDPDWLHEVIIAGIPFGGWVVDPALASANLPSLLDKLLEGHCRDQSAVLLSAGRRYGLCKHSVKAAPADALCARRYPPGPDLANAYPARPAAAQAIRGYQAPPSPVRRLFFRKDRHPAWPDTERLCRRIVSPNHIGLQGEPAALWPYLHCLRPQQGRGFAPSFLC